MTTPTANLRSTLRAARKARGWTLFDAADRLDVSRSSLQRWETGASSPTWEQLDRWIRTMGVVIQAGIEVER